MAKVSTTKQHLVSITGITTDQYSVLHSILSSVDDCMEWDKSLQEYTDGGRFLLSLTVDEMSAFKKLKKEL